LHGQQHKEIQVVRQTSAITWQVKATLSQLPFLAIFALFAVDHLLSLGRAGDGNFADRSRAGTR
jgi:hypothetical protein